jgi:apolipoprotein D and lipocalin family protein
MISLVVALSMFSGLASAATSADLVAPMEQPPLRAVDFVDPMRYVGNWYQVAGNPMPFEPERCDCPRQTLALSEAGIAVWNTCNIGGAGGPLYSIRGTAKPLDPTNAKLEVDFGLPRKGTYWVVGLDPDYRWAIVSEPSRTSLYILSKTPVLEESLKQAALQKAAEQLSLEKLRWNEHSNCTYP